jgi:hypothetical protein
MRVLAYLTSSRPLAALFAAPGLALAALSLATPALSADVIYEQPYYEVERYRYPPTAYTPYFGPERYVEPRRYVVPRYGVRRHGYIYPPPYGAVPYHPYGHRYVEIERPPAAVIVAPRPGWRAHPYELAEEEVVVQAVPPPYGWRAAPRPRW